MKNSNENEIDNRTFCSVLSTWHASFGRPRGKNRWRRNTNEVRGKWPSVVVASYEISRPPLWFCLTDLYEGAVLFCFVSAFPPLQPAWLRDIRHAWVIIELCLVIYLYAVFEPGAFSGTLGRTRRLRKEPDYQNVRPFNGTRRIDLVRASREFFKGGG